MFPIPWNFPLRKKNGNLVNIGDAIDEGTKLPEHTSSDEGKLLSVDENGDLEWSDAVNSEIQTLTKYANSQSNPNLLDNPFFTVNQRDANTYGATNENAWKYTVDRWQKYDGATGTTQIDVISGGITMTNSSDVTDGVLSQNIELPLYGKKVTLSAIIDGVIYIADGTVPSAKTTGWQQIALVESSSGVRIYAFLTPSTTTAYNIQIAIRTPKDGNAYTIRAVKLELGSVSTLASDTAPNYATELLKCQRYYITSGTGGTAAYGFTASTTKGYIYIPTAVKMRATPTVESLSGHIYFNGSDLTISSYHVVGAKVNSVQLEINVASGLQATETLVASNLTFALSADL